jgi:predicted transcriptional regulator
MKSYLQIITDQAAEANVSLLKAFSRANIPTSTYYRTINGSTEIRYDTALRVHYAIEQVRQIQQAVADTKRLRANGQPVNRRSIKARVKSRKVST